MHSLALTEDGTIAAWGNDWLGQCGEAPTENGFTQVAAGLIHNLALTTDGTIVAWGCDIFGDCNDAPEGTGFTQIAAGGTHSLALTENRSVAAWGGNNWFGQCNNEPTGGNFKQVDAGFVHSLALTSDGTIVAWGSDYFGQCSSAPAGTGFSQVAAGLNHNLELICTMFPPYASITAKSSCDEGSEICFDASDSLNTCDETRYRWKFGDGDFGSGATAEHMYTENGGVYVVTLTVTNPYGLADSETASVIVSNVAPAIDSLSLPDSASTCTPVEAWAHFSDPGRIYMRPHLTGVIR
ncbi:PKD domain-containing protein [Methanogenium cariaci]|uniref:PKD domain-containing protein n=1 Tax=Methanogenium cariaci TaxID=2197 RepID=UPI001FE1A2A4|nr:PKD domain-containing protein [Methanogenium cariaci]